MATKADFSSDEWKKLLESPLLAGLAIGGVVPGGFLSTLNQGIANAPALAEAKMNPSADKLISKRPPGAILAARGARLVMVGHG
jgi:hypothetical protein